MSGESGYLEWIAGHADGFVINAPRAVTPGAIRVLHAASCWTIGSSAAGEGRLTARTYVKACSEQRGELESWSASLPAGELRSCRTCLRGSPNRRTAARIAPDQLPLAAPVGAAAVPIGVLPRRWQPGEVLVLIDGISPLLASWNASTDPAQVRLKAYLDELEARARQIDLRGDGLSLDLVVDVEVESRLTRHYDLENYLTPIASRFGANRFVHAYALKRVGGGSSLRIGRAIPAAVSAEESWTSLAFDLGRTSPDSAKKMLRDALLLAAPGLMPPGPVAVDISWRYGANRNWVAWWKPTGDSMGPVLGEPNPAQPFNPADDRIVELALHRDVDPSLGHDTHVAIAWRSAP